MLSPNQFTNIIFDFDETIATIKNDWEGYYKGIGEIIRKYEPTFDQNINETNDALIQNEFYKKYGPQLKKEIDDFAKEYESKNVKGFTPIEKTINLIKNLENKNLYIWSSNYSLTVKKFLEESGLLNKFKLVVGHEMVDFIKPEPDGFNRYFKKEGDQNSFLFIGNSNSDRNAAKNSGIKYLDVTEI